MKTTLLLALALCLLGAGCVENMRDLKDRLGSDDAPAADGETVDPQSLPENVTPKKPPVARMEIYAAGGALLYRSSFQADNVTAPLARPAKERLTVSAAESVALERNATLASYSWSFAGATLAGRSVALDVPEKPGLYPIVLTVTDSLGSADAQSVALAVAPEPFEVTLDLTSTALVGLSAQGQSQGEPATAAFDVQSAVDGKKVRAAAARVTAAPDETCDLKLEVLDATGAAVGASDANDVTSLDGSETVEIEAPAPGAYTAKLTAFHCAAPEGVPVQVVLTYVEEIAGLGDGHAHGH